VALLWVFLSLAVQVVVQVLWGLTRRTVWVTRHIRVVAVEGAVSPQQTSWVLAEMPSHLQHIILLKQTADHQETHQELTVM
jgi:hypothetical protein